MTRWLRASAPVIVSALLLVLAGCGSQTKTVVETTPSVPTTSVPSQQTHSEATASTSTPTTSPPSPPAGPLTPHANAITIEYGVFRYRIEFTGLSILKPYGGVTSAQPGYTLPFAQIRVTNLQTDRPVPYGQGSFVSFLQFYARRQVIHPPVICERHVLQFCVDYGSSELADNGGQPGETLQGSEIDTLDAGGQDTVWIVGGQVKEGTQRGDLAIVVNTNEPGFQVVGTQRQPIILAR